MQKALPLERRRNAIYQQGTVVSEPIQGRPISTFEICIERVTPCQAKGVRYARFDLRINVVFDPNRPRDKSTWLVIYGNLVRRWHDGDLRITACSGFGRMKAWACGGIMTEWVKQALWQNEMVQNYIDQECTLSQHRNGNLAETD